MSPSRLLDSTFHTSHIQLVDSAYVEVSSLRRYFSGVRCSVRFTQQPMNQSPSRSKIAVNSLRMNGFLAQMAVVRPGPHGAPPSEAAGAK